ncbi:MAG: hypothetical protein AAGF72_05830 [Pseudomonadota bacterium]
MTRDKFSNASLMACRIVAILLGGYALWSGTVVLVGVALSSLPLGSGDGIVIASFLGFFFYLGIVIGGFAAPLRWRPATVIVVLGTIAVFLALCFAPEGITP